jgi:hypothetical protein
MTPKQRQFHDVVKFAGANGLSVAAIDEMPNRAFRAMVLAVLERQPELARLSDTPTARQAAPNEGAGREKKWQRRLEAARPSDIVSPAPRVNLPEGEGFTLSGWIHSAPGFAEAAPELPATAEAKHEWQPGYFGETFWAMRRPSIVTSRYENAAKLAPALIGAWLETQTAMNKLAQANGGKLPKGSSKSFRKEWDDFKISLGKANNLLTPAGNPMFSARMASPDGYQWMMYHEGRSVSHPVWKDAPVDVLDNHETAAARMKQWIAENFHGRKFSPDGRNWQSADLTIVFDL